MGAIETGWSFALFVLSVFAGGAALGLRRIADPLTRLSVGVACSLGISFAVGFAGYAAGLDNRLCALATAATLGVLVLVRRASVIDLCQDHNVRVFGYAWLVFAAWSLGLLTLVVTYSGGTWAVDWVEHWQRTVFFLDRQPLDTRFAIIYPLTARPPLVNLLTALWLEGTGRAFAQHQVFMTLLGSLVLLPLWILVRSWSTHPSSIWWLVLVLMVSPMVAQNLTFTWTKLPTAFLVLTAMCIVVSPTGGDGPRLTPMAGLCFGLAMLAHYSAGPWILAALVCVPWARRAEWRTRALWCEAGVFVAVLGAVMAVWVGWSLTTFGWKGTAASNTTAEGWAGQTAAQRATVPLRNMINTVVPFPLRGEPDDGTIAQRSRLGRVRDVAFNLYQVNLPLSFGLAGLFVLAGLAARGRDAHPPSLARRFWVRFVPLIIVTGIVVHTPPDSWGLAHICLQPLVLLGLARAAAALPELSSTARRLWAVFAGIDFTLGIALHFGFESWALAPVVAPGGDGEAYLTALARSAVVNARDKWALHFEFLSDQLPAPAFVVGLWLALIFAFVILRLRTARPSS